MSRVDAGVDVSRAELVVAAGGGGGAICRATFDNNRTGHKQLIRWLRKLGKASRVCLEATGIYGLDAAIALDRAGVEVMVVNPRVIADYAKASKQRSKTDLLDADTLLDYLGRMSFVRWTAPTPERLELRSLTRRIRALKGFVIEEKNRLHAVQVSAALRRTSARSVERMIGHTEREIGRLRQSALGLIKRHQELSRVFDLLCTISGVGVVTALQLMGELLMLPADMDARQLVAHAGLDPKKHESGSSVHKRDRISKVGNQHIRSALFMPAFAAIRHDRYVRAFYERLLSHGKTKLQATIAVARKLLHVIHALIRTNKPYDPTRFTPLAA